MSELIRFSHSKVLAMRWFNAQDSFPDFIESEPVNYEQYARELVGFLEDEACVAYWEAVISEIKKAINRHARWAMENCDIENPPDWWTKYQDEGI